MKKIKSFESFNEGVEKFTNYLQTILKKGGDFASEVWIVTKRESQETKLAVEILRRMLKGDEVSDSEKEFVRRQSGDLVRILPLVAIAGLPIPIPITPFLIILGKKYGFDFLPKDHRLILQNRIQIPQEITNQLSMNPETAMGYHIVDVMLKDGSVLKQRHILNSSTLILKPGEEILPEDIESVAI